MRKFTIGSAKNAIEFPPVSKKLVQQVLQEVAQRLTGQKKWCPNETLEQIILNKYTVIELEKSIK